MDRTSNGWLTEIFSVVPETQITNCTLVSFFHRPSPPTYLRTARTQVLHDASKKEKIKLTPMLLQVHVLLS